MILQARRSYNRAIVEQDILTDDPDLPKRCSQANRDYLKGIGL